MLDRTLREALRNHAAEFDRLESKKPNYRNNHALDGYLAAIDEMSELVDCGETLEMAFNGTFQGELRKFLLPAFKKYAQIPQNKAVAVQILA